MAKYIDMSTHLISAFYDIPSSARNKVLSPTEVQACIYTMGIPTGTFRCLKYWNLSMTLLCTSYVSDMISRLAITLYVHTYEKEIVFECVLECMHRHFMGHFMGLSTLQ